MAIAEPYPDLPELMNAIGDAGLRLAEIGAAEGAAGNISVYVGWETDPTPFFPHSEPYTLPVAMPELAGLGFLVTGAGRRLREIKAAPLENLAFVRVEPGGEAGRLFTTSERRFTRPTSEFNSHLAVHRDQIARHALSFHVLLHAQPLHLTYLSHIPRYQDTRALNRHILRWQPEAIIFVREGVGYVPFLVPGSEALMRANVLALREHPIVLWGRHGVMARSQTAVNKAVDIIEYAEAGARYETLNLSNGEPADGLSGPEIQQICAAWHVEQHFF